MLTKSQTYVLACMRRSMGLNAGRVDVESDDETARIILLNGIILTVYQTLSASLQEKLKDQYHLAMKQAILQEYEGNRVLAALGAAGMRCVGLKGWFLRRLYPNITMRQMTDIDILACPYQFDRINEIMGQLGFNKRKEESTSKHDRFYKGKMSVEIHKRLTDDDIDISEWEKQIWARASHGEGNVDELSYEDFYIHHIIHMYADFMKGSLGFRRIMDTWLLQRKEKDTRYVEECFTRLGIAEFHNRMVKLSKACMGETAMDENCEILINHACNVGICGTDKSHKAARIVATGSRTKSKSKHLFPPLAVMSRQYPFLCRYPVLLPYFWVKRLMKKAKRMNKNIEKLDYSGIREADVEGMRLFFHAGGVLT